MWAQNSAFELQEFSVVCLFLKKLLTCVGKRERKNETISRSRNEKFGPGLISLHCFFVLCFAWEWGKGNKCLFAFCQSEELAEAVDTKGRWVRGCVPMWRGCGRGKVGCFDPRLGLFLGKILNNTISLKSALTPHSVPSSARHLQQVFSWHSPHFPCNYEKYILNFPMVLSKTGKNGVWLKCWLC